MGWMPNFTKRAIKEAFWKLLAEKPLNRISVREIVEECGVNRNSFYYHFQDIPALLEEIVLDAADMLIQKYPSIETIEQAVEIAYQFTLDNKKAILHICNSVNRDIYEQYFMRICEYVVRTYFDTAFGGAQLDRQEREAVILLVKCEMFGLCIDWINTGMPEEAIVTLKRILSLCSGMIAERLEKRPQNAPKE
jgi:AcrR family transcriptional regulator